MYKPTCIIIFFLIRIAGGGVQAGSTRHVGHWMAYCTCRGWLWWWRIWWNEDWQGKPSTRRKPAPGPFCPPQIPLEQTRIWTRASAVGSQRLTAWAKARPHMYNKTANIINANKWSWLLMRNRPVCIHKGSSTTAELKFSEQRLNFVHKPHIGHQTEANWPAVHQQKRDSDSDAVRRRTQMSLQVTIWARAQRRHGSAEQPATMHPVSLPWHAVPSAFRLLLTCFWLCLFLDPENQVTFPQNVGGFLPDHTASKGNLQPIINW
jgi:hypothetical protein